jgi:hypothetical protein
MPMVPPLVLSPVLREARLSKELAALAVPGLVPVLGILPAPGRVTKPEPGAVALAAPRALALATPLVQVPAVAAEVAVINPVQVPATHLALVPAINPAEAVGTRSLFGDA